MWVGHLLLIYYFFVSLGALKCRLGSNEAYEPLWIPALSGGGVQFVQASLLLPWVLPGEGLTASASLN